MSIIFILSLIPVIIWAFMAPIASRFTDINTITTSIGQVLGLVGMALFAINLILAGRFKWLDRHFRGLDKVYAKHSKIGAISFSMLLFHPLFLVVKYVFISTQQAAMFFMPFNYMPVTWGIMSLLLMMILLSITFYFKFKYNVWKMSHKFLTLAFFIGVIHTVVISSDVSRNMILRYYILGLSIFALIVIIRKAIYDKLSLKKYKYKVKNVVLLNKDILEIEMEPISNKMVYSSGQFSFFKFIGTGVSPESHPFSISGASNADNLKITVKNLGDYTRTLSNLNRNDVVIIDGPYGNFSYKNVTNKNQIWIAGGIGITPFYSMAQVLDPSYHIDFYYSVKEIGEAVYVKELQDIAQKNPNFKFNLWCANEKGYISGSAIASLSVGVEKKDLFFCGPPVLMESLKNQFVDLGVDIRDIHYEDFSFNK